MFKKPLSSSAASCQALSQMPLLQANDSSAGSIAEGDWVKLQSRDRAKLLSLSSEKRELRLRTLQKTFDRNAFADKEKLTELRCLVGRIQSKITSFTAPDSIEKYLSLTTNATTVNVAEYSESSELMEDLYKILPLTVDSDFRPDCNTINCQFDSVSDL